jgi:hypothetical protein
MPRLRSSKSVLLVPAFSCFLLAASSGPAYGQGIHLSEYIGAEVGPGWFNLASKPFGGNIPVFSAAPTVALRFARLETEAFYWAPAQIGFGTTPNYDILLYTSTELGTRFRLGREGFFDFGLAVGAGVSIVEYASIGCDGPCWAGGGGAMFSPVVRMGYAGRAICAAVFVRFVLIANAMHAAEHRNYPLLVGLYLALRKS